MVGSLVSLPWSMLQSSFQDIGQSSDWVYCIQRPWDPSLSLNSLLLLPPGYSASHQLSPAFSIALGPPLCGVVFKDQATVEDLPVFFCLQYCFLWPQLPTASNGFIDMLDLCLDRSSVLTALALVALNSLTTDKTGNQSFKSCCTGLLS